ncbi:uncharacterized protein LOC130684319 [Manis pentadactyla]|uniref:uncharacterized protein LOC130684319 n=1 Tax=Manis pentadactyla TaxID=143292 RepID=UPI00255C8F1F|nr:uncharacterized protein LOC130684319 [Manis pentadactyla]
MCTDRADMRNLWAVLSTSGREGTDPGVSPWPSHPLGHYLTLHLRYFALEFPFPGLTSGAVGTVPLNLKSVIMGATFGRATPRNDGEKWRSRQGICVYTRVVVEVSPLLLATPTPVCGPSLRLLLLPLLLLLLPAGAWPQPWKGAEVRYTLIEKQLAAVYHALLAMEPIAGTAPTKVITTYPITGWVRDWTQRPWSGVAQTPSVYHVTGHLPLASPEKDEADTLAQVHWLERKPASDVAQWLHQCLLHAGQKTMWAHWWGLPLTFEEVS